MHFMTSMQYFPPRTDEPTHSCSQRTTAPDTSLLLLWSTILMVSTFWALTSWPPSGMQRQLSHPWLQKDQHDHVDQQLGQVDPAGVAEGAVQQVCHGAEHLEARVLAGGQDGLAPRPVPVSLCPIRQ